MKNLRLNRNVTRAPIEEYSLIYDLIRDPRAINLAVASLNKPLPRHIRNAVVRALDEGETHYTSSWGNPELRRAIAQKLERSNKLKTNPDKEILVTMGAGHGFLLAMQAVLAQGDEVITPNPSFPLNFGAAIVCGAKPISIRLRQNHPIPLDIAELRRRITRRTKMIVLVSPENPTGVVYPRSILLEIAEIAKENNIIVLSDEVYENLVYDGYQNTSIGSLKGMKDLTVSIFSFSKDFDLSGFRIGYLVAGEELLYQIYKVQRNDGACASSISQVAALTALGSNNDYLLDLRKELDAKRRVIVKELNSINGVKTTLPSGGCYVFPDVSSIGDEQEIYEHLVSKARVAVTPGNWYGVYGKGHLRICYGGVSLEKLQEAIDRIRFALNSFQSSKSTRAKNQDRKSKSCE